MNNYINDIAKINKQDRFNAIVEILNANNIAYRVQQLPSFLSMGNIIVEYNPEEPSKVVLCAHYDTVGGTPGANDNASAVNILLNLAIDNKNTKSHLVFLFSDGEESGFVGTRYYLDNESGDTDFAINLDMCGVGTNILVATPKFDKNRYDSIKHILTKHYVKEVDNLPPGDTISFINKNIPTLYVVNSTDHDLNWYDIYSSSGRSSFYPDFLRTMHQPNDTVDTINIDQVEKIYLFVKDVIAQLYTI